MISGARNAPQLHFKILRFRGLYVVRLLMGVYFICTRRSDSHQLHASRDQLREMTVATFDKAAIRLIPSFAAFKAR
jgi:hypothetical protein